MRHGKMTDTRELFSSPLLRQLQQQAQLLKRWTRVLHQALPSLAEDCQVAAYRHGLLTLVTTNNALAGQIRYLQIGYIRTLQQHTEFKDLNRLKVLVGNLKLDERQKLPPLPRMSPSVVQFLQETADHLDDPELSQAFRRLARHGSDKPTNQLDLPDELKTEK